MVQGVEATVEKLQSALAEREAEVTVREVASISAEARLAQKSAYLESYEARLHDWEARMRGKAAALQQWQADLQVSLRMQSMCRVHSVCCMVASTYSFQPTMLKVITVSWAAVSACFWLTRKFACVETGSAGAAAAVGVFQQGDFQPGGH